MPSSLVTALVGALASNVVGSIFGGKDKGAAPVAPPTVAPATPMPDPGALSAAQRRKKAAERIFGAGALTAENTLLSRNDKLG